MRKLFRDGAGLALGVVLGYLIIIVAPAAHALPEYGERTGQPCATCHVNPAGGGQRTLQGLLWIAQGRPDQVPDLPSSGEAAVEGAPQDDRTIYQEFGCAGCHGSNGEGTVGPSLNEAVLPADSIRQVVRNGQGSMLGYSQERLSDAELEAIVRFVQALGAGEGAGGPVLQKRPLPPPSLACGAGAAAPSTRTDCGGN